MVSYTFLRMAVNFSLYNLSEQEAFRTGSPPHCPDKNRGLRVPSLIRYEKQAPFHQSFQKVYRLLEDDENRQVFQRSQGRGIS